MNQKPKLFPTHFNLILDGDERWALENLYDLDPHLLDEVELLHQVIHAGIRALNQVAEKRLNDPHRLTRTQIESSKTASTKDRKAEVASSAQRAVENYACAPLSPMLRRRLGLFLTEHPGMSEEEAIEHLLGFALDATDAERPRPTLERAARRARLSVLRELASNQ